jgi:hypothetical protein
VKLVAFLSGLGGALRRLFGRGDEQRRPAPRASAVRAATSAGVAVERTRTHRRSRRGIEARR